MFRFLLILRARFQSIKNGNSFGLTQRIFIILGDSAEHAMLLNQVIEVESNLRVAFFLAKQICINHTLSFRLYLNNRLLLLLRYLNNYRN